MSATNRQQRKPRSIRKHLRRMKAILRRTLPLEEAERAIAQLVHGVRRTR